MSYGRILIGIEISKSPTHIYEALKVPTSVILWKVLQTRIFFDKLQFVHNIYFQKLHLQKKKNLKIRRLSSIQPPLKVERSTEE